MEDLHFFSIFVKPVWVSPFFHGRGRPNPPFCFSKDIAAILWFSDFCWSLKETGKVQSKASQITSGSSFQLAYVRSSLAPALGQVCSMQPITSMLASRPPGSSCFGDVCWNFFVSLEMRNCPVWIIPVTSVRGWKKRVFRWNMVSWPDPF